MPVDVGLLILRIVVGLYFVGHGTQKLFGWFGGYGLAGTSGFFASMGFRPARFWAFMAGMAEAGGGLLILLGLLTPLGAAAVISSMLIAIAKVHWPKPFTQDGGFELPVVYTAAVTALALAGPGFYSLDAAMGFRFDTPLVFIVAVAAAVIGDLIALGTAETPRSPMAVPNGTEERRAA